MVLKRRWLQLVYFKKKMNQSWNNKFIQGISTKILTEYPTQKSTPSIINDSHPPGSSTFSKPHFFWEWFFFSPTFLYHKRLAESGYNIPVPLSQAAGVSSYEPAMPLVMPSYELRRVLSDGSRGPDESQRVTLVRLPQTLRTPKEWWNYRGEQVRWVEFGGFFAHKMHSLKAACKSLSLGSWDGMGLGKSGGHRSKKNWLLH